MPARGRVDERARIGFARRRKHRPDRSRFHDPTLLHHDDRVADLCGNPQIVRDEQNADIGLAPDFLEQDEDFRLNGYVKRRNRFIGHQQARFERERAGDADALALAARKLMRVALHGIGIDTHEVEEFSGTFQSIPSRHAEIDEPLDERSLMRRRGLSDL